MTPCQDRVEMPIFGQSLLRARVDSSRNCFYTIDNKN
ncbi:MAG: hypothetical protein UW45_C0013G0027 [Parcubacteria group bacterium GW2011_GWC2_44_22]|nr:MAG: hypothetical protein UW45_C0013G0027 [Parcubacteria group bacterium GW2011_GWC2_44_22]